MIVASTATVFRGGGRRWFTLSAAANAEARGNINKRCDCDKGPLPPNYPPVVCKYHNGSDWARKVRRRLARVYLNSYREPKP